MTEVETMLQMCLKKKPYYPLDYAEKVAADQEAARGVALRVYYCPICNRYHLTKKVISHQ